MSLEAEAIKSGQMHAPRRARPPTAWDWLVRAIATVLLLAILAVVYWIPMELLGGFAAALVLAALTMLGAGVASRLHQLRVRVDALETVLDERAHTPAAAPAPSEEIEKQP